MIPDFDGADDLDDAREVVTESGEGAHLWREIQVLRGSLTGLSHMSTTCFEDGYEEGIVLPCAFEFSLCRSF